MFQSVRVLLVGCDSPEGPGRTVYSLGLPCWQKDITLPEPLVWWSGEETRQGPEKDQVFEGKLSMPVSPKAALAVEMSLFLIILIQISLYSGSHCRSLTLSGRVDLAG